MNVLAKTSGYLTDWLSQLRVAVVRSGKLVAEARGSLGTQREGNVHH
jgi:hypothetical protein